jgi:hypothetical protein
MGLLRLENAYFSNYIKEQAYSLVCPQPDPQPGKSAFSLRPYPH